MIIVFAYFVMSHPTLLLFLSHLNIFMFGRSFYSFLRQGTTLYGNSPHFHRLHLRSYCFILSIIFTVLQFIPPLFQELPLLLFLVIFLIMTNRIIEIPNLDPSVSDKIKTLLRKTTLTRLLGPDDGTASGLT